MGIGGPFQQGDTVRIPLEVLANGKALAVANARVQRLVLPDGTDDSRFPQAMVTLKNGTYILEEVFNDVGNYTAILQAEFGGDTIEEIESFIIEKPFGIPRIEIATDT